MSIQHIDASTGEVLDGPPRHVSREHVYKERPRHSDAELRYMRIRGTNRPSAGRKRGESVQRDINAALVAYAVLVTLYALTK